MNTATSDDLTKAIAEARRKDCEACNLIERAFPPGTHVRWFHGDFPQEGRVIHVSAVSLQHARMQVCKPSGKVQWIDAFRILRAKGIA